MGRTKVHTKARKKSRRAPGGGVTNFVWILPILISFAPIATASMGPTVRLVATAAAIVFAIVAAGLSYHQANSHNDDRRPNGLFLILSGQLLVAATALIRLQLDQNASWLTTAALAIGVVMSTFGVIRVVAHRMGSRPSVSEREFGIASAGIALIFIVLITLDDSGQQLTTLDKVIGSINTLAGSGALFAMFLIFWLMSTDRQTISVPLGGIAVSLGASGLVGLLTAIPIAHPIADRLASGSTTGFLAVLAFGGAVAGYVHPQISRALAPSVIVDSEVNVRRSIVSFSVVLVGPLLIGIDQLMERSLSLPTITIGSSALSFLVAVHLLGLVRRWVAVEHQGQHDPLTSLPNRPLFFSRLGLTIESARSRDAKFVTMFLDLDRFKAVNDSLGHDAGDELLRQVANRLSEASRRVSDDLTVARLGGDEFAIIVPEIKDPRHSHAVGRLFLDQFLEPFDVGLRDIYVTPSIGIAEFPKDGDTVEQLIENADTAMFEAKEQGRNTVVSYSPDQRVPGAHRLEIEAALHRAVERDELELYFQPQVDLQTGKIVAVEALIRWVHPTLGRISPEKFVPVAEESSLIDSIGRWIIDEACRAAARWEEIGLPPINVAVNLSPRQFQKSVHLVDNVQRALRESGLSSSRLELELTESLALEKPEEVNETLVRFREMGIRTAIDDFGVGHTGLDYLDRITVDTLKIDRSFINRIGESGAPLVTAVISLAKGLNLDVIAEGVETRAQVNFLASHGCRYMQGYLFSKPLTGPQLEQVLRNQMRREQAGANNVESVAGDLPNEPDIFDASAA